CGEWGSIYNDPVDPMPTSGLGVLLRDITSESIQKMLNAVGPIHQSPNLKFHLRQLGGAVAAKGGDDALGGLRSAGYVMYLLGVPMPPNSPELMRNHAEEVIAALGDLVLCRGPLNWLGEGHVQAEAVRGAFEADTYARLVSVKQQMDPENMFRFAG